MKKFAVILFAFVVMSVSTVNSQETIKLGVIYGFTGPIESLTPAMAWGAELAVSEVSDSGALLNGASVEVVRADSTCTDSAVATAAAERLVTADKVNAIVGGDCSGVTGAILQNVARPNGIVMISPSATSPGLSVAEDDGLFFRTAPSDARQAQVMTDILLERGYPSVAVTYTNNDYGKALSDSFSTVYQAAGGKVTINTSHEDGKGDYSAEVGALAAAGGDALVVIGYLDQGGRGIIQASVDTGAFETYILPDGMIGESLIENIGDPLNGSFGQAPGSDTQGVAYLIEEGAADSIDAKAVFVGESYDAAALILLAMQAANSSKSIDIKDHIFAVANAPGEKILPGELGQALTILANGGEIDYVGASDVELIGPGEASGRYREIEIIDGEIETVRFR